MAARPMTRLLRRGFDKAEPQWSRAVMLAWRVCRNFLAIRLALAETRATCPCSVRIGISRQVYSSRLYHVHTYYVRVCVHMYIAHTQDCLPRYGPPQDPVSCPYKYPIPRTHNKKRDLASCCRAGRDRPLWTPSTQAPPRIATLVGLPPSPGFLQSGWAHSIHLPVSHAFCFKLWAPFSPCHLKLILPSR
jgi:hypothetical protein